MSRVVVVGSINSDTVVQVPRLPRPGETVLGRRVDRYSGGKGLNQAVAAARLGGGVALIGAVGDDPAGTELRALLTAEGVTDLLRVLPHQMSGAALIEVADDGENSIVVIPGANALVTPAMVVDGLASFDAAAVVLAQAEIPWPAVEAAMTHGRALGAITILNPSPAREISDDLMRAVDVLVTNEHEAALLTGAPTSSLDEVHAAAAQLVARGPQSVVVTRGHRGAVWATEDGRSEETPAYPVVAVDAVGAGDAFCGALAVALGRSEPLGAAVRWASAAGALATTRRGAAPSLPHAADVDQLLRG